MGATLEQWERVHKIFNPIEPATAELRVARGQYNPLLEEIVPRLALRLEHQKYVLAGGIGSGKSTELYATVSQIRNKLVVLIDLYELCNRVASPTALDHLQPAELVGLLGLAIVRAGTDKLNVSWGALGKKFETAIAAINPVSDDRNGPAFDLGKLAQSVTVMVGGIKAVGEALGAGGSTALALLGAVAGATTWSWRIGLRDRKRTSDQDPPVRAVLQTTNALLDYLRQHTGREVVLLVDGLDRVQNAATFEDLFVESRLLHDLRCDLVASLQLGLVQRYHAQLHWCKTFEFTAVLVAKQNDPTHRDPRGIQFFKDLATQRFNTLGFAEPPIPPKLIEALAFSSGGRLRDFISLVREVTVQAMLETASLATTKHIEEAIDGLRRHRESGLNTEHLRILTTVLQDPRHQLPAGDIALELLDRQLLLAYPNNSTWYLPHTILIPRLQDLAGATVSA